MKKYRPPLKEYEIEKLEELSKIPLTRCNEVTIREEFIKPLLDLLGYSLLSDYEVSREDSFKLHPLFQQVGSTRAELDYICAIRKKKFWLIEAKTARNRKIREDYVKQAYFYSLLPEVDCPYFLVINGWYINLYKRDELDEELNPILSISNDSLPQKFLELDSYIGSTQILPYLKNTILKDIKKVLSTEIYTGRLDEFMGEVEGTISSIRGNVITNFKRNEEIQQQKSDEYIKYLIEQEEFYLTPHSIFDYLSTIGHSKKVSNLVLNRFKASYGGIRQLFLSNLLLEEPKPVTRYYYSNVLIFLIELYKSEITSIKSPFGNSSEEILLYWIRLLLFSFAERPELRYLWAFEGLVNRLTIRTLILKPEMREQINSTVNKQLYILPEELVAFKYPHPAEKIIRIIENQTTNTLSQVLRLFYQKNKFKQKLCYQEYTKFKNLVEKIEEDTEEEYLAIKRELGSNWGTVGSEEFLNHYFDSLNSAVCDILQSEPNILKLLKNEERKRIEIMASIRIGYKQFKNTKIVNFAKECCDILDIKAPETKISLDKVEKYFDPNEDPFSFNIKD